MFAFLLLVNNVRGDWFKEERFRFRINVPDSWQKSHYQEGKEHVYDFMSRDKKIAVQIRVFEAGKLLDITQLIDPFEDVLMKDGIQKLSIDECIHNGTSGKLAVYTTGFDSNGAGIATFYTIKNGLGYIVLFILPNHMFDTYKEEMDQIMKSFEILGPPEEDLAIKNPMEEVSLVKISKLELFGSYQDLQSHTDSRQLFNTDIQKIFASFEYNSAGNPQAMIIRWVNTDNGNELGRTIHQAVSVPGGAGTVELQRPGRGWQPGNYRIELIYNSEVIRFLEFAIEEPMPVIAEVVHEPVQETIVTAVEEAPEEKEPVSLIPEQTVTLENKDIPTNIITEHYYKLIKLGPSESFDFQTGSVNKKPNDDLVMEVSCDYTQPVIKGNFVLTGKQEFTDVIVPPDNGSFQKVSGDGIFTMPLKEVAVFRLEDGSYAKFKVVKHAFLEAINEPKCRHYIEAMVEYPAFQ